jgi:hypothetical protein
LKGRKHRLGLEKDKKKYNISVGTNPRTGIMIGGRSRSGYLTKIVSPKKRLYIKQEKD